MKESDIQIQIVDYLEFLKDKFNFMFFSVPNEAMGKARGVGGLARMARLKRMGMRHGVADLVIIKEGQTFFLEVKADKGKQSEHQKAFEQACKDVNAPYALVHSFDEAEKVLKGWKII